MLQVRRRHTCMNQSRTDFCKEKSAGIRPDKAIDKTRQHSCAAFLAKFLLCIAQLSPATLNLGEKKKKKIVQLHDKKYTVV